MQFRQTLRSTVECRTVNTRLSQWQLRGENKKDGTINKAKESLKMWKYLYYYHHQPKNGGQLFSDFQSYLHQKTLRSVKGYKTKSWNLHKKKLQLQGASCWFSKIYRYLYKQIIYTYFFCNFHWIGPTGPIHLLDDFWLYHKKGAYLQLTYIID